MTTVEVSHPNPQYFKNSFGKNPHQNFLRNDVIFLGGGESSRKESMTRYESDWKMVNDYLQELQ